MSDRARAVLRDLAAAERFLAEYPIMGRTLASHAVEWTSENATKLVMPERAPFETKREYQRRYARQFARAAQRKMRRT